MFLSTASMLWANLGYPAVGGGCRAAATAVVVLQMLLLMLGGMLLRGWRRVPYVGFIVAPIVSG